MSIVTACCCCLETDRNLFRLSDNGILEESFGIPFPTASPSHICVICINLIRKFRIFKQNSYRASYKLQQLQASGLTLNKVKFLKKDYGNNFTTIPPIILSYKPPSKILYTSNVESIEIKPEFSHNNTVESNIRVYEFNHDLTVDNLSVDNEINDESNGYNGIEENDVIIKYETDLKVKEEKVEETTKTGCRKRKQSKNNSIMENYLPRKVKYKKDTKTKKLLLKNNSKEKNDEELKELVDEKDEQSDQFRKYATQFYNSQPRKKKSQIILQNKIKTLEKFSKANNVEVKFLSQDEQERELEERKHLHKGRPYICNFCFKGYTILGAYASHMKAHDQSSGDFECNVCKIRCKTSKDRDKHIDATHLKRYICKQCGLVTKSQPYARAHFAQHSGSSFACDQCDKKFTQRTSYLSHKRVMHSSGSKVCPLCYHSFLGPIGLKVHIGIAHKQTVQCSNCDLQFDNETALNKHLNLNEIITCGPDVRSCPICGINFSDETTMRQHIDEQHMKTEFKCEECSKSFVNSLLYVRHIRKCSTQKCPKKRIRKISEGKKNREREQTKKYQYNNKFMCEQCGKGNFASYAALRYHQRAHTGERPYPCLVCQKTFRDLQFLKLHMRTHTDERRYKCPFCAKAFRQYAHRTAHLLTHTKERPYACTTCSKRYTGPSALKEHINTIHMGLPPRKRTKNKDKQEL